MALRQRVQTERGQSTGTLHSLLRYRSLRILATGLVCLLFVGLGSIGHRLLRPTPEVTAQPVVKAATTPKVAEEPTVEPEIDPLATVEADMNTAIAAQSALTASATLINLDTGKTYNAGNYTELYTAASTAKLVAVFDYIHQVELGKTTLSRSIEGQSAQDIIMRMIVYSDNDAWTKLNTYLKMKNEQAYVNSLGVSAVVQANNVQFSTPNMAKLLQMLYDGKLMNTEHQTMVYDYMAHTTVKNLIQAVLPIDATVYHKYGQIEGVLHDAALIKYQGHNYVLVVYTNNPARVSTLKNAQVNLIHAITTAAWQNIVAP